MKLTATVPLRISAAQQYEPGAKNQRTGKFQPTVHGVWASMNEAQAGDTILVSPGVYGSVAVPMSYTVKSHQTPLTFKSIVPGEKWTMDCAGVDQRVLNVLTGASLTLEDAIITNNKRQYSHNAGVHTGGGKYDLILRRCILHWLSNGILIGQHPEATVLLEDCDLFDNGDYIGQTHNAYVGTVASFTMRRCRSYMKQKWTGDAARDWIVSCGHLVKSRAAKTIIEDCDLLQRGCASNRALDLPNGGDVTLRRNRIEYWTSQNGGKAQAISFGVEEAENFAAHHPLHRLIAEENTIVNRSADIASTIWLRTTLPTEYVWRNNIFAGKWGDGRDQFGEQPSLFYGTDPRWAIPMTPESGNRIVQLSDFVDAANSDYRLKAAA